MSRNGSKPQTKYERSDALALCTDDQLKTALVKKREFLLNGAEACQACGAVAAPGLTQLEVDMLMPEFDEIPELARQQYEQRERLLVAAIQDIDRRLAGAIELLRAFGNDGAS